MISQDGFTPKEKAQDLIKKFGNKELPVLMCNEIINYEFYGSKTQLYWNNVKRELLKCQ